MIKDCSEFDTGKHDVFVGIEHRLRCEKAQEEWNNLGKQCHKIDAYAGMTTMYVRRCYGAGCEPSYVSTFHQGCEGGEYKRK